MLLKKNIKFYDDASIKSHIAFHHQVFQLTKDLKAMEQQGRIFREKDGLHEKIGNKFSLKYPRNF